MTSNTDDFFRDNPWDLIEAPCYPQGRRLYLHDERFWVSVDDSYRRLFFIQDEGAENVKPLENLAGLQITIEPYLDGHHRLICRLISNDPELADKFATVTKDIAFHCSRYQGSQLFTKTQERIKSWANFLKPTRSGLTQSEFVGLLGELFILTQHLLPSLSPSDAVRAWIGPEGKKQDFTFENVAIEVKTTVAGDAQTITISSLDQLDQVTKKLYLLRIVVSPSGDESGFCLGGLYETCLEAVSYDVVTEGKFLQKASELYGKASESQIKDNFLVVNLTVYRVDDEFPKLTRSETPSAIRDVQYQLNTEDIARFEESVSIVDIASHG